MVTLTLVFCLLLLVAVCIIIFMVIELGRLSYSNKRLEDANRKVFQAIADLEKRAKE